MPRPPPGSMQSAPAGRGAGNGGTCERDQKFIVLLKKKVRELLAELESSQKKVRELLAELEELRKP